MNKKLAAVWYTKIPENRNTTRYQRIKALCDGFQTDIYILQSVPDEIENKTNSVHVCPGGITSYLIFPVWALINLLLASKYDLVHTAGTDAIPVGYVYSRGPSNWVIDIWDDPEFFAKEEWERGTLIGKIGAIYHYILYYIVLKAKLISKSDELILSMNQRFVDSAEFKHENIFTIPNGTDISLYKKFKKNNSKNNIHETVSIIYVGFVNKNMGLSTMLDSIKKYDGDKRIELEIVGKMEDPIENWVQKEIQEKDINGLVTVHRELPHDRTLEKINSADVGICLFPKQREFEYIYPIKIFEYMALNTVVIASDLNGISDIIKHKKNGLLVEPDTEKDLLNAIYSISEDNEFYQNLIKNASEDVSNYDWSNINNSIVDELKSL